MDSNTLAIIAILVLLAIVGLGVLKGLGRRKIREAGENKQARIPATLQEFGRSVVLGTDAASAVALVEGLPKSRLKSLRPGVWGLNQISKEDAVIEVWPVGSGSEVLVTSLEEHFGFPQGLDGWQKFAAQLEAAATAQGVSVQRGARTFQYQPAPANSLDHGHWVLTKVVA
ncbi:hypothetical protein ITJ57_17350 [Plantibacter sp. VKM Ac-2880]|uniref:hypothetical protein n=1 Tax=Plantibacter sp. VKM Ac-2880 TaxID=2783827 RepID=UPI00188F3662|nr:hypothetical protein [Plantibacter sp. VKM Ac-2880]MBF4570535.1 hypothetical protein [Plantibacter sp. VKM Ac-2880]